MIKVKKLRKNQLVKIIREFEAAIKTNCYDCMGGQKKLDCEQETCALYPFRPWAKNKFNKEIDKDY